MITDKEICCEYMAKEIYRFNNKLLDEEGNLLAEIGYDESRRMYHIQNNRNPNNIEGLGIVYCPWCGEKLPLNLDSWAWIEYEYGEEYASNQDLLPPEVQKEFETDAWWKNRHLDDPKVLAEWVKKIPRLLQFNLGAKRFSI